jgi:hypothetical protein
MVTSPSFCCSRAISRSRGAWGRFFSTAWPAVRNCARHFESQAALTPSSRESNSRSSPRNRRKTISTFRWAEKRLGPLPTRPGLNRGCLPDLACGDSVPLIRASASPPCKKLVPAGEPRWPRPAAGQTVTKGVPRLNFFNQVGPF